MSEQPNGKTCNAWLKYAIGRWEKEKGNEDMTNTTYAEFLKLIADDWKTAKNDPKNQIPPEMATSCESWRRNNRSTPEQMFTKLKQKEARCMKQMAKCQGSYVTSKTTGKEYWSKGVMEKVKSHEQSEKTKTRNKADLEKLNAKLTEQNKKTLDKLPLTPYIVFSSDLIKEYINMPTEKKELEKVFVAKMKKMAKEELLHPDVSETSFLLILRILQSSQFSDFDNPEKMMNIGERSKLSGLAWKKLQASKLHTVFDSHAYTLLSEVRAETKLANAKKNDDDGSV